MYISTAYLTLTSLAEFSVMGFCTSEQALFSEINILCIIHSLFYIRFCSAKQSEMSWLSAEQHFTFNEIGNVAKYKHIGCTDQAAER